MFGTNFVTFVLTKHIKKQETATGSFETEVCLGTSSDKFKSIQLVMGQQRDTVVKQIGLFLSVYGAETGRPMLQDGDSSAETLKAVRSRRWLYNFH